MCSYSIEHLPSFLPAERLCMGKGYFCRTCNSAPPAGTAGCSRQWQPVFQARAEPHSGPFLRLRTCSDQCQPRELGGRVCVPFCYPATWRQGHCPLCSWPLARLPYLGSSDLRLLHGALCCAGASPSPQALPARAAGSALPPAPPSAPREAGAKRPPQKRPCFLQLPISYTETSSPSGFLS